MGGTRTNNPTEREDPRVVAERCVYRNASGQLNLPGGAFARMLREAGSGHKAKGSRRSLKYIVPAAVLVTDDLCGLFAVDRTTPLVDFEVDARPVTIPATKGRVMRYRARLNSWVARVALRINEDVLSAPAVRGLFVEGGQQIGVGDFRPEKGGPFGTFHVVSWQV